MSPTPPRPKPGTRVYHRDRGEFGVVTDQATRARATVYVAFIGEDDDPVEVAADALDIVPRPHGRQHWQAQYQADAQARQRKAEDRVLAAAARPGATEYVREVAASIRDHREMAARRAVWAAGDRLGIPAPPAAADSTLEYVGMSRTDLYRLQARYLNHLAPSTTPANSTATTASTSSASTTPRSDSSPRSAPSTRAANHGAWSRTRSRVRPSRWRDAASPGHPNQGNPPLPEQRNRGPPEHNRPHGAPARTAPADHSVDELGFS